MQWRRILPRKFCVVILGAGLLTCNHTTTQELVDGDFLTSGRSPIKLTVPANGTTITNESNMFFAWSAIPGVGRYKIELSENSTFTRIAMTKIVSDSEYLLSRSDFSNGYALDGIGYYWRVSVPYVKYSLMSSASIVNYAGATSGSTADSTFYVDNTFTGTSYGTKNQPFKTIQAGLDAAAGARAGSATAKAEVRVSKGTYNESIGLRGNVALRGGYDSTQNWARNPAANQTVISISNAIAISGGADLLPSFTNTLMEGFKINVTNSTSILPAMTFTGSTMTLRNNQVTLNLTAALAQNTLVYGLNSQLGTTTLDSNVFTISTNSTQVNVTLAGIIFDTGGGILTNNIIYVAWTGAAGPTSYVTGVSTNNSSNGTVLTMTNNTVFVSSVTANVKPTPVVAGAQPLTGNFDRNILYGFSPANNNICSQLINATSKFTTLRYNALVDCYNSNANGYWLAPGAIQGGAYATPWLASANAGASGASLDGTAGANFLSNNAGNNPVNGCAGVCSSTLTGNRGGFTIPGTPTFPGSPSVIFQGYVAGDPTTFTFKPNTIADMDNNGQYDASVDAGANTATTGLVLIP